MSPVRVTPNRLEEGRRARPRDSALLRRRFAPTRARRNLQTHGPAPIEMLIEPWRLV